MSLSVTATDFYEAKHRLTVNRFPDECPVCHTSMRPRCLDGVYHRSVTGGGQRLQVAFQCMADACGQLIVATYKSTSSATWLLANVAPVHPKPHLFSAEIQALSPTFVDIHNQTVVAEAAKLDQLTGIGLRKALEFLVKDYAISQKPNLADKIKAEWLGKCIKEYIDDPRIKQCAKLGVWLANDETHYIRKWEDKDINDLKVLIKLTVNWVENSLLTNKYRKEMEGGTTSDTEDANSGKQ